MTDLHYFKPENMFSSPKQFEAHYGASHFAMRIAPSKRKNLHVSFQDSLTMTGKPSADKEVKKDNLPISNVYFIL